MSADTLDRARAVLADVLSTYDRVTTRDQRVALAEVASAAVALVGHLLDTMDRRWGGEEGWASDHNGDCMGCARWVSDEGHVDDCPAMALDAAIRRLAGDA